MDRSDVLYPSGLDDTERVCSWLLDVWSWPHPNAKRKTVKFFECGKRFRVWNHQANHDPWALCPEHARMDKMAWKKMKT